MSQTEIDRLNKLQRDRNEADYAARVRMEYAERVSQLAMIARRRKAAPEPAPKPELFAKVRRRIVLED